MMLATLLFSGAAHAAAVEEIPFEYKNGLVWVDVVTPSSKRPLKFLLDSGAAVSVLNMETALQLHVKFGTRRDAQGVHTRTVAYEVDGFDAKIGRLPVPDSVLAIDLHAISQSCGVGVDGLLGADFFKTRVVQVDFVARVVRVLERARPANGAEILPLSFRNQAMCAPIGVNGNASEWMRLDTGCNLGLHWVVSGATKIEGVRESAASIGLGGAEVIYTKTTVKLGNRRIPNVGTGVDRKQIFPGESGLVGTGLLSKFKVTFDAPGGRVIFERS